MVLLGCLIQEFPWWLHLRHRGSIRHRTLQGQWQCLHGTFWVFSCLAPPFGEIKIELNPGVASGVLGLAHHQSTHWLFTDNLGSHSLSSSVLCYRLQSGDNLLPLSFTTWSFAKELPCQLLHEVACMGTQAQWLVFAFV